MDIKRNDNRKVQGARCKVQSDVVPGSGGWYKKVALPGWNGYPHFSCELAWCIMVTGSWLMNNK